MGDIGVAAGVRRGSPWFKDPLRVACAHCAPSTNAQQMNLDPGGEMVVWKPMKIDAGAVIVFITILLVCAAITYCVVVVLHSGTVPLHKPGWVTYPNDASLRPKSKQWLGFRVGQPRDQALENACQLVAARAVTPKEFQCPLDRSKIAGLDMSDSTTPSRELWAFRPHLLLWQRHCFGFSAEELSIYLEGGQIKDLYIRCGSIVVDL